MSHEGARSIVIRENTFDFLPTRTIFWREKETLLAADLHWGKSEVFQRNGVPVPKGVLKDDLARLSSSLYQTAATRLMVLGDLVHSATALTDDVVSDIAEWRAQHDFYFHLILGNHDRRFVAPANWKIDEQTSTYIEDKFLLTHDQVHSDELYVFNGHVHPMARLNRPGDSLRLPCFVVKKNSTLLPAFSIFTGGVDFSPREGEQLLVIADGQVIKL